MVERAALLFAKSVKLGPFQHVVQPLVEGMSRRRLWQFLLELLTKNNAPLMLEKVEVTVTPLFGH